jgi:hypothetical protein
VADVDLSAVMDELADRLRTIPGSLNVFASPPGTVLPPAAIVTYPDTYDFDTTYGRGTDRMALPVWLVVGRPTDPSTKDALAAYCAGDGARSIKAVLESNNDNWESFDQLRVTGVEFDAVRIGDKDYMAAGFNLDIIGDGA